MYSDDELKDILDKITLESLEERNLIDSKYLEIDKSKSECLISQTYNLNNNSILFRLKYI